MASSRKHCCLMDADGVAGLLCRYHGVEQEALLSHGCGWRRWSALSVSWRRTGNTALLWMRMESLVCSVGIMASNRKHCCLMDADVVAALLCLYHGVEQEALLSHGCGWSRWSALSVSWRRTGSTAVSWMRMEALVCSVGIMASNRKHCSLMDADGVSGLLCRYHGVEQEALLSHGCGWSRWSALSVSWRRTGNTALLWMRMESLVCSVGIMASNRKHCCLMDADGVAGLLCRYHGVEQEALLSHGCGWSRWSALSVSWR